LSETGTGFDYLGTDQFEIARQRAKARVAEHWFSMNWNMWNTYNSQLNPTWKDPWFEYELSSVPFPDGDTDYQMAQNLYCLYCWFNYKGYGRYAAVAELSSAIQESHMSGGSWEGGTSPFLNLHPYPNSTGLIGFPANYTGWGISGRTGWYSGVWYNRSGEALSWQASATDGNTGETVTLSTAETHENGMAPAIRHYPILMKVDEETGAYVPARDEQGNLQWNRSVIGPGGFRSAGGGYGFCQFTPWHKIIKYCNMVHPDGGKHWQLSLTMQLMAMEKMREETRDPTATLKQWNKDGYNSNDPAGFTDPITHEYVVYPPVGGGVTLNCTWDDWADQTWLPGLNAVLEERGITGENAEWCRVQEAMSIYRVCFLGATYGNFNFYERSRWIRTAFDYWDNNGGWRVEDIPRPRDIDICELDQYHITFLQVSGLNMYNRRRQGREHISTIFV